MRLPERIDYVRRLVGTALSFALFGLGSLVLWGLLFPLAQPFLGLGHARNRRARALMHATFRIYVNLMRFFGVLACFVDDSEALNQPGRIVISNHPSLLDIVLLIAHIRNATCFASPNLFKNVVMRLPIRAMNYIYASEGPMLLEGCARELRAGSSLIIFPEGTRTPGDTLGLFQRGAANIALYCSAPILPVYIDCHPAALKKHEKWYHIPPTRVSYRITVGTEIDPSEFAKKAGRPIAARRLTEYLQVRVRELGAMHH